MPFFRDLVHHPRRLWLRRAVFQVHLWAGVLLSLYVVMIALTGAVLVWEDELTRVALPPGLNRYDPAHTASPSAVMQHFAAASPGSLATDLILPSPAVPAFRLTASDTAHHRLLFVADPVTADLRPQGRTSIAWAHDLHVNLLLGEELGLRLNGMAAAVLFVLAVTGIVLWWPGVRIWVRGLRVSVRHNWRRINYDLHSAIGFWTLLLVLWWAFSGIYFTWYRQITLAVNAISPLEGMLSPGLPANLPVGASAAPASLADLISTASHASPHGRLYSIGSPSLQDPETFLLMDLRAPADFSHRDIVRVRTADARLLTVWHYGENHSLGDWILWSMHPLHFGTLWGWPGKVLWCALGVSLAVLSATGLLMYWNRYLRLRWRRL